jgi:hypothetical protein
MENTTDLIVVKQLPEIVERLAAVKANISEKALGVLALECNEETVKTIKGLRADLNRDFAELEERRKFVKAAVLKPYEDFEAVYRDCVTNIFKPADERLKNQIAEVEDCLKEEKKNEVRAYFDEYAQSLNIDFVPFERSGITVTLSASAKKLKEQAKAFIDRIADDLALIDTQAHKAEILVEYKRTLNASLAITSVTERHNAIEAERARQEQKAQVQTAEEKAALRVDEALSAAAEVPAQTEDADPVKTWAPKRITHRLSKLRALKQFLIEGGYEYE